eukprot:1251322-Amphidinium_carterae.1
MSKMCSLARAGRSSVKADRGTPLRLDNSRSILSWSSSCAGMCPFTTNDERAHLMITSCAAWYGGMDAYVS